MKGAIVFLAVFALALIITLNDTSIPFGRQIYNLLGVPDISYPVLGIGATTLVISVFNGVFYGFIVWFVFSLVMKVVGGGTKKVKVTVSKK